MGDEIVETRSGSLEDPATPITGENIAAFLASRVMSDSGIYVSPHKALTLSPIWQAVSLISNDVARIPLQVWQTTDQKRELAKRHPVHKLLRKNVGQWTANIWMQMTVAHALLYGNSYSIIHRGGPDYQPVELEWLHADDVRPMYEDGIRYYLVGYGRSHARQYRAYSRMDIFHLQGLTLDELGGLSPIHYARNYLGRQLATGDYASEFFANSSVPTGFFEHPAQMSKQAQERFLSWVESRHRGAGKRHRNAVLEEDMKWKPAGVSPKDAMLLDQLKWGVPEVARLFNVPRHKLNDDANRGYNTTEQENKAYFNSTLGNWTSRIEYEVHDKLFTEAEKDADELQAVFHTEQLFRADTKDRYAAHAIALQWNIKTPNEVRAEEGLNPAEGGDEFLPTPNASAATQAGTNEPDDDEQPADDVPPDDAPPADRTADILLIRDVIAEPIKRMAKRLGNAAIRATKHPQRFLAVLDQLEKDHQDTILEATRAICRLVNQPPETVAHKLIDHTRTQMLTASECDVQHLPEAVTKAAANLETFAAELADTLAKESKS